MNYKDKEFDEAFKLRGGICSLDHLEINSYRDYGKNHSDFLRPRYPDAPEVNYSLINSDFLNAAAAAYNGNYFIGVNLGTCALLSDLFLKILACPDTFPHIGNPSLESVEKKSISASLVNGFIYYDPLNGTSSTKPNDSFRARYAAELVHHALDFLIFHEYGHIFRGHLGYLSSLSDTNANFNFDLFHTGVSDSALNSRTLEMDADSFAANNSYLKFVSIRYFNGQIPDGLDFVYKDLNTYFGGWSFAVYSLFKLFNMTKFDELTAKRSNYPPPDVRSRMIFGNIASILNRDSVENGNEIVSTMVESVKLVDEAFGKITYAPANNVWFSNYEQVTPYIAEIIDNWVNLHDLLLPFSYGDLPPKQGFV